MQKVKNEIFCLPCCRSIEHAEEIVTAILRGNEDQALAFMCWRCSNYNGLVDEAGRTALHIASSCGKTRVLRWLLKDSENVNLKDRESGYTPLHRSMFHGQLNAARYLIMHGARLDELDNDGLTALDHAMRDKIKEKNYPEVKLGISPWKGSTNPMNEVYVWGSNSNFNLGIGNHQIRRQPDTIDFFWKNKISIKRVAMGKFHSIFLCEDGRVYSCGLGQGGRLGLDSEETVMTPNQINISTQHSLPTSSKHVVISMSVGQDHSLLVTDKGAIYSFGMNDHYQLGLDPPPPFQLSPKALPLTLRQPVGVSAAHYHSVAWSQVYLYTWGYNCGQLGYKTQNKYQITPKLVPNLRNSNILAVASADSAIVLVTDKGDIFLLRGYGCLKIGSLTGLVRRIEISGGRLDPALIKSADVSGWGDYRTGEDDLKVLTVVWEEKTMFWQSSTGQFSRCCFQVGNRFLKVADAALGINKLIVVTDEYEAFETDVKTLKMQEKSSSPAEQTPLQKLVEKDTPVVFHMRRIGCVYRAINAYCDPKGLNFAIIQINPIFLASNPQELKSSGLENSLISLLEEATESDYVSDVVFSVAGFRIPAHRYVIETNCTKLASMVNSVEKEQMSSSLQEMNLEVHEGDDFKSRNILTVKLDNFHPLIFREILKYIYSGQFDYCTPSDWSSEKDAAYASLLLSNETLMQNYSAHYKCETVDQSSSKEKLPSKKLVPKDKNTYLEETPTFDYNPVVDARRTAIYFELKELVKNLDNMVYNKKKCVVFRKSDQRVLGNEKRKVCLNLQYFQHLYDVVIECCEGKIISAHKCILTMRSKYFDTMLKGNWLEIHHIMSEVSLQFFQIISILHTDENLCKERRNLFLPFPYDVMEAILIYLYQDKVPFSCNVEDVAFICQVLVAADHILVDGLKSMCEVTLAHLLTLKNVSELYKFSDTYSAYQLRSYCLKYIVPNISALLESRALDTVDDDLFTDIQLTYWDMTPVVLERSIGIPIKYPDLEQLQSILENVGVPSEEEYFNQNGNPFKSQPKKEGIGTPKKRKAGKRHKLKKSSIDESDGSMTKLLLDSSHSDNLEAKSETLEAAISLDTADVEPANFSQGFVEEDMLMMDTESKLKETPSILIPNEKKTVITSKQEIVVSPQIEKEFPSLTGDMHQPSPTSSTRVPKQRMTKLSQKARKKLRASAGIADEPLENPSESTELNAWKKFTYDSQEEHSRSGLEVVSLSEIMNQERLRCPRPQRSSLRESFSEDNSSSPAPSSGATRKWSSRVPKDESKVQDEKPFDQIMADELKQREMTKKIMEKSLNLTQVEDKAIKELQLLYEKEYEFEERITVRRKSSAQASKPVWKTSKNP